MTCPECESERIGRLPPNDITRNPGWICASCGLQMRYAKSAALYWWLIAMCGVIALFLLGMIILIAFGSIFDPNFKPPKDLGKMIAFGIGFTGVSLYVGRWALAQARKPAPKVESNTSGRTGSL